MENELAADAVCGRCGRPLVPSPALGYPPICSDYFCASGLRPHTPTFGELIADLAKSPLFEDAVKRLSNKR